MLYYHAKCLDSALCASFASFYLRVLHVMECLTCSCYCCCNCCCYLSYCVLCRYLFRILISSRLLLLVISLSHSSHVSLNARVILSSSHFLHSHFSISLRFSVFLGRKTSKTFPEPLVLGRFIYVLRARGSFKVDHP